MSVYLEPVAHKYYNTEIPNMDYTSVTTVLGKYKEKFDDQKWSAIIAQRDGKTQQQVLAEWKKINDDANIYGTALHEILERFLLAPYRMYTPRDDFEERVIDAFRKMIQEQSLNLLTSNKLHPERIMHMEFNQVKGIAGTSDIIEDVKEEYFNVWDFKTNKKFRYESAYREFLKFPLSHLSHCEFNDYAMQLSVYALMYEKETGRKFNRAGLFYWDKTVETFQFIAVPYLKMEAQALIDHYQITTVG